MKNVTPYVFVCVILGIFLLNMTAQASVNHGQDWNDPITIEQTPAEAQFAAAEWESIFDFLNAGKKYEEEQKAARTGKRTRGKQGENSSNAPVASAPTGHRCSTTGGASYYGPGFHGRRTASGQIFNANGLTAAHRTLPFGTIVKVTAASGRSVTVRINDRGPFHRGRIIDLSAGAARAIGISTGIVRLECQ